VAIIQPSLAMIKTTESFHILCYLLELTIKKSGEFGKISMKILFQVEI
jgi:hypothetical protein